MIGAGAYFEKRDPTADVREATTGHRRPTHAPQWTPVVPRDGKASKLAHQAVASVLDAASVSGRLSTARRPAGAAWSAARSAGR